MVWLPSPSCHRTQAISASLCFPPIMKPPQRYLDPERILDAVGQIRALENCGQWCHCDMSHQLLWLKRIAAIRLSCNCCKVTVSSGWEKYEQDLQTILEQWGWMLTFHRQRWRIKGRIRPGHLTLRQGGWKSLWSHPMNVINIHRGKQTPY